MKFSLFDAHTHLNLDEYNSDREAVLSHLSENSIGAVIIGVDFETSKRACDIASSYPNLFAGIGLHPVDNPFEVFSDEFLPLAQDSKVVCIGECGLDYFRLTGDSTLEKARQREIFLRHVELARAVNKPLMLHCRPTKGTMDAYEDTLDILEAEIQQGSLSGNAHFFVGDKTIAKRFLKLGFTMSFPGVITFAHDYDDVIKMLPLESILSETDAPFATPVPYRGTRNEPKYVEEVVKKIAEIRGESYEEVRGATIQNALRLFKIN